MKFVQSFIFNRTVLGLLVAACFVVTALDLFFDGARTRVIRLAALETARNDVEIISQLSSAYKEAFSIKMSSPSTLVDLFNQKLGETGSALRIKIIHPETATDTFQSRALTALSADPAKAFHGVEESEESSVLRYVVINTLLTAPGEESQSILEIDVPMGPYEIIQNKEAVETLWILIIMAIVASFSMAIFVGYLRHSSEILTETQAAALEEQRQLTNAYERFFPHQFLDLLEKKSILDINLGDQAEKKLTVVFADIRNFTTLIEKMTAADSFRFINTYLGEVGPIIREHSGFIDKYIGDAVMSLFPKPDDAIAATIKMMNLLHKSESKALGFVEIGAGIHFGSLMVGTVGEARRMDGTVISDVVNTASRLEALNKGYGTHIIISQQVLDSLVNKNQFKIRYLDHIFVRGKTSGIKIYEVFDIDPPYLIAKKEQTKPDFEKAMESYRNRQFKEAVGFLQNCQTILPEDPVILLFLKRCAKYIAEGTPEDWVPITKLLQKDVIE